MDSLILYLIALKLLMLFLGFPIAFSAIFISKLYIFIEGIPLSLVAQKISFSLANFTLLAIPLFMLAGKITTASGISDRIFDFALRVVGRIPGGLGHVNVASSLIFSGMSGSALADVAGLGEIEYKAMTRKGYDPDFSVGVTLASSALGPILPPSLPMVIFGVASGVSITGMFVGGILPAFFISAALMAYVFIVGRRNGYVDRSWDGWIALVRAFFNALPALMTPVLIVGGMLSGVFSATEAATAAVLWILFSSFVIYRRLSLKGLYAVMYESVTETSRLLYLIACGLLLGWVLTDAHLPQMITAWTSATFASPWAFFLFVIALLLVLGAIVENAILILVLAPMLTPVALDQFGIEPIHFGVCIVFAIMLGQFTPPIGLSLFVMRGITGWKLGRVSLAVAPFLVPLTFSLLVMALFPAITMTIPRAFGL
ncbi:MAG: TRAP transporter large permease [Boseongicola sp.]|nr:TRAP transporter large permease [Boseongicola sp.]